MRHIELGTIRIACGAEILDTEDVDQALCDHETAGWSTFSEWLFNFPNQRKELPVVTKHVDRYDTKFIVFTNPEDPDGHGRMTHVFLGHRMP